MHWQPLVAEYLPTLAMLCRQLGRRSEPAQPERNTAALISATLVTLGLKTAAGPVAGGVTGLLPGQGPAVAVRVVIEPPSSRESGEQHCVPSARPEGGSIAVALGAAMVLSALPAPPGTVKFIFQPAGEGAARRTVEQGVLCDPPVEAVFGFHLTDTLAAGQIGLTFGQASAAADDIRITVLGRGPQAGQPIDAILVAAQIVSGLQALVGRQFSPGDATVITVGTIRGGRAAGLVADRAELAGTVASFTDCVRTGLPEKIERLVAGVTAAHGASYRFVYSQGCPPHVNDARLLAMLEASAAKTVGRENVLRLSPDMAGEDFAHFARTVPGACWALGTGLPRGWQGGRQTGGDACEEALAAGVGVLVQTILDYLAG